VPWLTTVRSHDQYNTAVYSMSDRYRSVFGQRDVLFINAREMLKRASSAGAALWPRRPQLHAVVEAVPIRLVLSGSGNRAQPTDMRTG
jgi:hypothetical protein